MQWVCTILLKHLDSTGSLGDPVLQHFVRWRKRKGTVHNQRAAETGAAAVEAPPAMAMDESMDDPVTVLVPPTPPQSAPPATPLPPGFTQADLHRTQKPPTPPARRKGVFARTFDGTSPPPVVNLGPAAATAAAAAANATAATHIVRPAAAGRDDDDAG